MKKQQREKHKLVLDRETIRQLSNLELVTGGRDWGCSKPGSTCSHQTNDC